MPILNAINAIYQIGGQSTGRQSSGDNTMFVRTLQPISVANKVYNRGKTVKTTASEGKGLIDRGYAVEVDKLDEEDEAAQRWQTTVTDNQGNKTKIDDMTGPTLKAYLDAHDVEYQPKARVNDLKDLVEEHAKSTPAE